MNDEEKSGKPSISYEVVTKVEDVMNQDRRFIIREFALLIPGISKISMQEILKENSR